MEASNGREWDPRRSTVEIDFAAQICEDTAAILDWKKWYGKLRSTITKRKEGDQWS